MTFFYYILDDIIEFTILFFRWKYTGAFPLQPHLWDHWDLCPPSRGHHGGKYDRQLGLDLFVRNYCPKPAMKRLLYLKWVRADLKLLEIWNLCWLIKPKIVFISMFIVQDPSQPIQVRNLKNKYFRLGKITYGLYSQTNSFSIHFIALVLDFIFFTWMLAKIFHEFSATFRISYSIFHKLLSCFDLPYEKCNSFLFDLGTTFNFLKKHT